MSKTTLFAPKPLAVAIGALCTSISVMADTTPTNIDEQMVVTATRTQMELKNAPASMSVITADDIANDPGITLADIVANQTSVEADYGSTRAGRQQISIRGMEAKYTLIMVNGRRMSSASAIVRGNDFDLSTIPMDSIERIEIIRGPMSALYGSDGMGGTINIITKSPENDWSSQLSMDNTTPNDGNGGQEYTVGLTTSGALIDDTLFARLSVSQTSRDAWQPYSGIKTVRGVDYDRSEVTAFEGRDTLALFGTLSWHLADNQFIDLDLGYSDDERDTAAESATRVIYSESRVRRDSQAISHTGLWSWGDTQVRYSRENVENVDAANDGVDSIEELTQIVEASATTYLGDSHTLTFGVDYQNSELSNPENLGDNKAEAYQGAVFVQDQWAVTDTLTATIGGRLDKHEQFGEEFSPRVYLVHQTTDSLVLKGGVGKAFKAPTMTQNNPDFKLISCKGNCDIQGNEDLGPETSINYELSALYSAQSWNIETALFRNEVENLIEQTDVFCETGAWSSSIMSCIDANGDPIDRDLSNPYKSFKNVSKAVIQGAELSGSLQISEQWAMSANYTYLDTEDKSTGEELNERYKHSAFARLNWYPTNDLDLFASARYRSERKIDSELTQDSYTTLDLGTVYHVNESLRLRAGITNLTDESVSKELENIGYVEAPRTYYVGMTANF
ncbi:TonB-dependent receptor domain-containing protein [Vibrio sp. B1FLJ16]|uniref:TonB-dependent receptor domain-containing protein n=1 Tax=Vibrio sp. B1FLJ16 TaxID=2751178 RepID=UPI0015F4C8C5|nr:TonB-dependent receptor [Vibrio sp. B1FLJ16]CAD7822429.1 Iron-regulated outer membrane virulence protein [Vibrio sp. B1FLJ16]CAE6949051.1 Iron-regulated outer membrane virulence protein [Vibrio sp. B1FLJ16]